MQNKNTSTRRLLRSKAGKAGWLLVVLLALSGCDRHFGLRMRADELTQVCDHHRAYIAAFQRDDQAAMQKAAAQLRTDIQIFEGSPSAVELFTKVADAAAAGNVEVVQQNVEVNCQSTASTAAQ